MYLYVFRNDEWMLILGGDILQTLAPIISVFWLFKRYLGEKGNDRKFWLFLSIAMLCYTVSMILWDYYEIALKVEPLFPSISDFSWNIMNLFLFLALIYPLVKNYKSLQLVQVIYDTLIVIVVATSVSWEFILSPILQASADQRLLYKIAGASYPIGDLIILFGLLCIFNSKAIKLSSEVSLFIFLGMCSTLIADTRYLYLLSKGLYSTGHLIDVLWSIGAFMIGISSFYSKDRTVTINNRERIETISRGNWKKYFFPSRLWIPYIGVITLLLIMFYQQKTITSITIGSMISILLIIFRQIFTLTENQNLLKESMKLNTELEQKVQQRTVQMFEKNQLLEESLKKIEYLAYHDPLTDLPNRRYYENYLGSALLHAKENDKELAVLFLDLDRFKLINDTLGHSIGDLLLQKVAKRLLVCINDSGIICRQGGDEFLILLTQTNRTKATTVAEKILESLRKEFQVNGHELFVTSSIGICMYPDHGKEPDVLTKRADVAMYAAKKERRNQYMFFDLSMDKETHAVLDIEKDLRYALDREEFRLVYQPLIQIQTGKIVGVEALIRWHHPVRGWISPQEFIPVAEETDFIIPMGLWVLETACKQWMVWRDKGFPLITIAVNISINQFLHPNFLNDVRQVIKKTGIQPEYLELEITENIPFVNGRATEFLEELRHMGIKISIDDFGTGYSSLQYLKKLPINKLKIDQLFIRELPNDPNDVAIVQTIITMAHHMKLEVVAEGVETKEQLEFLQKHLCHIVQGYLFSKPLTVEEFENQFSNIEMLLDVDRLRVPAGNF